MSKTSLLIGSVFAAVAATVSPALAADSLIVNPPHPTTSDSLALTVKMAWDCCTEYLYDSTVAIGGSQLLLSCRYQQPQTCPELLYCPGSISLIYKSGRLQAGAYAVYESKQIVCPPGMACAEAIAPVKIGEITVLAPTAVRHAAWVTGKRAEGMLPARAEQLG